MTNGFNVLRRLAGNVTVPLAAVCLGARADFTNEFVVADGSFHDAANWSSNAVPDSTMRAHVSGDRTARISSDVTVNRFGVGVTGNGTVIQTGGNVRMTAVNNGGSNVNSAASFYLSGADRYDSAAVATSSRYALYHLVGGTVDVGSYYCHIGQHRDDRNSSEGVLRITGGSFTTRRWTAIGRFTEHSHGHLLVEDEGAMTVTQEGLNVGESGSGALTVRNGGELTVNAPITFAADGSVSVGRGYVLDGGRVTGAQFRGIDGKGKQKGLFVDGGILSPDCSAIANSRANWITGLPAFNIGSRGAIFDTAGRDASVPQVLTVVDVPERLATNNLVHRWSFNGDLVDSVGNQNATAVNANFTDFSSYTLPGGTKNTGYIDLGSDILPKDGSGVTLEIWATQLSAQNYSRVFEIGLDTTKTMSMAWSTETRINEDRIDITYKTGSDKGEFYDIAKTGPYTLGIQYHIAWVFTPPAAAGGAWTITVYKHDAMTGALLASHVYSPPAGWTLPAAPQNNCWLGHSLYNDYDAAATFDEVRVWKTALTEEELAASVRLGPDTTFGAPGAIVKRGSGRLDLLAATNALDVVVENGVLAAGTGRATPLVHRWTFNNGDLTDKGLGGKNAWIVNPTASGKVIVSNATSITLPGGAKGTAGHIELGKDILPSDGGPFTLELWATVHGSDSWIRAFTFGRGDADNNKFMMAWNRGGDIARSFLGVTVLLSNGQHPDYLTEDLAPFTRGTEYHIAVTMTYDTSAERWRVTGYKQDATTGVTLKTGTFLVNSTDWSPAKLAQDIGALGYSTGNDKDAYASYNEMRVWSIALTEEQLTQHAQLGPDTVPDYSAESTAVAAPLSASARLDVRAGASLDLCNGTNTVTSLTGEGTVQYGNLTATDGIRPGNGGASGTLKLAAGATLGGPLVIAPAADGTCGALEADGALDLSGLDLTISDGYALKAGVTYTLATCAPGQLTGTFRSVPRLCNRAITYDVAAGKVTCKVGGCYIFFR